MKTRSPQRKKPGRADLALRWSRPKRLAHHSLGELRRWTGRSPALPGIAFEIAHYSGGSRRFLVIRRNADTVESSDVLGSRPTLAGAKRMAQLAALGREPKRRVIR